MAAPLGCSDEEPQSEGSGGFDASEATTESQISDTSSGEHGSGEASGDETGDTDGESENNDAGGGESGAEGMESETSGDESGGGDDLPDIDPSICPDLDLEHALDRAACPELQGRGLKPQLAGERELCRRLFVDLVGRVPLEHEFEARCAGRRHADIVDELLADPAYNRLSRRLWADTFLMTSEETYYAYIVELDEWAGQLHAGALSLYEFAERAVAHPAFTGRFDGQDRVSYAFQAFLGRDAAPHERDGLEGLWHVWRARFQERHPEFYFGYPMVVMDTRLCRGTQEILCRSDLWGHHGVVPPPVDEEDNEGDGVNVIDVDVLDEERWQLALLPGRLIAEQPAFLESAADRALLRYLGHDAGKALPRVRQALVEALEDSGGNVLVAERLVLTSFLYRMAHGLPDLGAQGIELPLESVPEHWHGPVKQMQAEVWADSLGALTAVDIGRCDHRFPGPRSGKPSDESPNEERVWHPNDYPRLTNFPESANAPNFAYRNAVEPLGGCPDQVRQTRFTGTGVMISVTQAALAQQLCLEALEGDSSGSIYPADLDPTDTSVARLVETAEHIYGSALLLKQFDALDGAIEEAAEACRDDSECDAQVWAFQLCTMMFESAPFLFY